MRNLLIALVLGATALMFYSALWFKSEAIEDDITARVTDNLISNDVENINIDVDGRHVTLTGIVYNAATEDAYLDTADSTYGALGPIDGLTLQADHGYINAIKTADGLTLRGTVPNADLRAELVAAAGAATDGAVDDQLVMSGPEADWQGEAVFGVGQLAGLTSGTMTATADAYALFGATNVAPDSVTADLADRAGWSAFVSSSVEEQGLVAEIDRLNGAVAVRTSERDAVADQLADLRAGLTEGQADADDLRLKLDAATATVGERDRTIEDLTGQLEDGSLQIAALEKELANRQAALSNTDDRVIALGAALETANGTISDLTNQVSDRDESIANLTDLVADRDATIEGLTDQVTSLSGNANQSVADLTNELALRDDAISDLTASVSDRDQQIASLTGTLAERDAAVDGLTTQLTNAEGRFAAATDDLADREERIANLTGQVADLDGSVASMTAQIATLAAAAQTSGGEVDALAGRVADLTETVAQRDETIAALQAQPASTGTSAAQCATQATSALEGSRINFETGSAQISSGSIELMERLTGIALACVSDDLSVEIGGHTDAQGEEDSNQVLSEARAQAVLAFMAERGVPNNGLQAIGYGESQPIASNDTPEGRAQNRRISFDWQAR